jgi:Zn-dependent protease with chaperone function
LTSGAFAADYYDGRDSTRHRVEVVVSGASLLVRGADVLREHAVSEARVQPRVGSLPVRIALPDGAILLADADAVAAALPLPRAAGLAHRLESHLGVVLASIAGVVVAGWFGYRDGVPWLAGKLADHIPPALESQIAEEGMKNLDRVVLRPTAMDAGRQARLRAAFAKLEAGLDPAARNAHLEFRDGGWIGANAFAIPGGAVVLTDQLAALLDDEHILAVLAHELGHLHYRHGTRNLLQDSIVGLGSMALFGDATSVSHVAAALPTMLLHTGYSRDFEREADAFAFGLLKRTGRSPRLLGEALASLEKARNRPAAASAECKVPGAPRDEERPRYPDSSGLGYLSTHPATEERIRAAEAAAR